MPVVGFDSQASLGNNLRVTDMPGSIYYIAFCFVQETCDWVLFMCFNYTFFLKDEILIL